MNEQDLRAALQEALEIYMDENLKSIRRVQTFEEAGLLTSSTGLVVRTKDGSEFQLTIVQNK